MTGRRLAILTVAAAATALVLSGRQRHQRAGRAHEPTTSGDSRSRGHGRSRRSRCR